MRRANIFLIAVLAGLVALPTGADARKRSGYRKVVYTISAPLRVATRTAERRFAREQRYRRAPVRRRGVVLAASTLRPPLPIPELRRGLPPTAPDASRQPPPSAGTERPRSAPAGPPSLAPAGWVGPLYWPYGSDDLFDYALHPAGADERFWARNGGDLADAVFVRGGGTRAGWADMCGSRRGGTNSWIDPIEFAVEPTDAQHPALDELQAALVKAGNGIKVACPPADTRANPVQRLDAMTDRLWAMRQAVVLIRMPLETLVDALAEDQKGRLNAVGSQPDRREFTGGNTGAPQTGARLCADPAAAMVEWPSAEIAQRLRPSDEQRRDLETLRTTVQGMAQWLMASCPAETPATPLARLDAAEKRLNAMLYAARIVGPVLGGFYNSLSEEQKAAFHSIGRPPGPGQATGSTGN
jgi:LTXXQ motif family protein